MPKEGSLQGKSLILLSIQIPSGLLPDVYVYVRHQCPFHGQIVDRDDKGVPIAAAPGPSSSAGPSSSGTTGASSETWEDIQQEVFAAKG